MLDGSVKIKRRPHFHTMTSERKRISIYDYPEHLNPFSEAHLNVPDKRKIFVDKLRKTGTWSSKISKRLNRSVSWIEKSWLAVDDSPRRTYENRICNDLHNNALYSRQSLTHNATRTESCSDVRHDAVETSQHMQTPNGNLEKTLSEENINKCDIRRRKKRPAPLPPNPSSPIEKHQPEADNVIQITDNICEIEGNSQDSISFEDNENEVANAKISGNDVNLVDEIPSVADKIAPSAPCEPEQTLSQIDETELSEEIQNLQIESNDGKSLEQSKSNENEISQVENEEECENVDKPLKPDENSNISSIKNENEIKSETCESNTQVRCNGKAVLITSDDA